jgi:hypothetical protein
MPNQDNGIFSSYKNITLTYFLLVFGLFFPFLFLGEVTAPHLQYQEVGLENSNLESRSLKNRKFSDYSNAYIPEISTHLNGSGSGWLSLWTDKNGLGRPVYQISGFSPAYLPSWVIARFTTDPWRFITTLSLLTCLFAGYFIILFCGEINLAPLAGLIAGTSLTASPLFMYWLTFPMFPAVWCWSAGVLWSITRLSKKPDLIGWGALAFSGYSLLMTAYPQPVVFHAYLLGGYGFYLAYRKLQDSPREMMRFVTLAISAVIIGAALASPVYRDLAVLSAESARATPDPSFFTLVLPKFANVADAVRFFVLGTVPELFGNPVASVFPFPYDGLSVTPLIIFFSVIGLLAAFKQTWGWWLAIIVFCAFAFMHPLYVFGVKYLGFNLSRSTPLGSITLPLTVITAYGVDTLLKRTMPAKLSRAAMISSACVVAAIAVGLSYGITQAVPIRWGMLLLMLLLAALLAAQHRETRPVLLLTAMVAVLISISYPLMLRQDRAQIATTSPLVETIRKNLPLRSRFAVAAPGVSALPPNTNASFGLASVHSYNSLSPIRYHTLIEALGGELLTYGRWNRSISPDYASPMFWMSNISLILSPTQLIRENLKYLGEESGVHLHRVVSRMGDSLQVALPEQDWTANALDIEDARLLSISSPNRLLDEGDVLEFEVLPATSSVLVLSQIFHQDWHAQVLVQESWEPAQTAEINGVFQGVLVPSDAQRVRLEFRPFARHAWVAHVSWLLLLALLASRARQKSRSAGRAGA